MTKLPIGNPAEVVPETKIHFWMTEAEIVAVEKDAIIKSLKDRLRNFESAASRIIQLRTTLMIRLVPDRDGELWYGANRAFDDLAEARKEPKS